MTDTKLCYRHLPGAQFDRVNRLDRAAEASVGAPRTPGVLEWAEYGTFSFRHARATLAAPQGAGHVAMLDALRPCTTAPTSLRYEEFLGYQRALLATPSPEAALATVRAVEDRIAVPQLYDLLEALESAAVDTSDVAIEFVTRQGARLSARQAGLVAEFIDRPHRLEALIGYLERESHRVDPIDFPAFVEAASFDGEAQLAIRFVQREKDRLSAREVAAIAGESGDESMDDVLVDFARTQHARLSRDDLIQLGSETFNSEARDAILISGTR